MTVWRRSPRPLGVALDVMRDRLSPETVLAEVQRCWLAAVGASIAAQAVPTAERGGVLTVSCAASVWAHELDLMGPRIVEKLNEMLGGPRITRLRCISAPAG